MQIDPSNSVNIYNQNFFNATKNDEGRMDELVHLIFSFLGGKDLESLRLTCSRFKKIVEDGHLQISNLPTEIESLKIQHKNKIEEYTESKKALVDFQSENNISETSKVEKKSYKSKFKNLFKKQNSNNNSSQDITKITDKELKKRELQDKVDHLRKEADSLLFSMEEKKSLLEKKQFNRKIDDLFGGKNAFERLPFLEIERGKAFFITAPIMRIKFKGALQNEKHFALRITYKNCSYDAITCLFTVKKGLIEEGLTREHSIFEGEEPGSIKGEFEFDGPGNYVYDKYPACVIPLKPNTTEKYYEKLKFLIVNRENELVKIE